MAGMLKPSVVQKFFSRNVTRYITNQNFTWEGEGIQYTGFKYYPKDPDFKVFCLHDAVTTLLERFLNIVSYF